MTDFVGAFNFLGRMYESNGLVDLDGKWLFQDPSLPQVKQNLVVREQSVLHTLHNARY
jgi:hypothetical protein